MKEEQLLARKRRDDRLARWFITSIGIGTILSVLAILVVIVKEIIPLFESSEAVLETRVESDREVVALGIGSYMEKSYSLSRDGKLIEFDLKEGKVVQEIELMPKQQHNIVAVEEGLDGSTTLTFDDGHVQRETIKFRPTYDENGDRTITLFREKMLTPKKKINAVFALSRRSESGRITFAQLDATGQVHLTQIERAENFLGEVEETENESVIKMETPVLLVSANPLGTRIYTYDNDGKLEYWNARDTKIVSEGVALIDRKGRSVTTMTSMIGGEEVVLGFDNGDIEVYALAIGSTGRKSPTQIHHTNLGKGGIVKIVCSPRDRTLFAIDQQGVITAWYSTSERILSKLKFGEGKIYMGISNRGLGLITSHNKEIKAWSWDSSHPEAGFHALFSKVWYASYPEPTYSWQSSSGSDDFEPKLSLVPLIFGSIKGAFYAMLFSIPFAVFAALYTSVFATSKIKGLIKPTVELMAAIPSVVIGFLAALWLAPLVDANLLTIGFAVPVSFCLLSTMPFAFGQVKGKDIMVLKPGLVLFVAMILILLGVYLSNFLGSWVETIWFAGDFRGWLNRAIPYDIRNSMIIGVALGFTVIPVIYTISEDALSSVPKGLTSASLALGATPWQTAWRVVLPAASPGIFAAITLGLGRAVGETMIVLMATGNTAIMTLNPFEGFRALSANIAVEIPEAPHGGTLYRVLFLSAGVLLIFTSILNTATEFIRQRLAKTYSRF